MEYPEFKYPGCMKYTNSGELITDPYLNPFTTDLWIYYNGSTEIGSIEIANNMTEALLLFTLLSKAKPGFITKFCSATIKVVEVDGIKLVSIDGSSHGFFGRRTYVVRVEDFVEKSLKFVIASSLINNHNSGDSSEKESSRGELSERQLNMDLTVGLYEYYV